MSETEYWKEIDCMPRCDFTQYRLKMLTESNYDSVAYWAKTPDGANMEV